MSGNNFLNDETSARPANAGNNSGGEPAINWSKPAPNASAPAAESGNGLFDLLKNTGEKKNISMPQGKTATDFQADKQMLGEYDKALRQEKSEKNQSEQAVPDTAKSAVKSASKTASKTVSGNGPSLTLKTNLIKEDVTTFVDWQKNIILLLIGLIFVALVIGSMYAYLVLKEHQAEKEKQVLSADIQVLQEQIKQAQTNIKEADDFQKKLNLAADLLDKHIYWSEFFKFIEDNTLANTFYSGAFSGDNQGSYQFSVEAKSYQDVDDQIRVFKANPLVLEANVSGAALAQDKEGASGGKVTYSLGLVLSPEVFKKK